MDFGAGSSGAAGPGWGSAGTEAQGEEIRLRTRPSRFSNTRSGPRGRPRLLWEPRRRCQTSMRRARASRLGRLTQRL